MRPDRIEHIGGGIVVRVRRVDTRRAVIVPSVEDALALHHLNERLARDGHAPDAPWWPKEGK